LKAGPDVQVLETVNQVRAARTQFGALGLVPTMGYLHEGHLSLVRRAHGECGATAVSIFVNPTQFGRNEDLSRYPRDLERDLALLAAADVDLVFVPAVTDMYPAGFDTWVEPAGVTAVLEGAIRPGHFRGVATVVTKLFNIVQPTRAYFGQKDAQQTVVIQQIVRDLNMPIEVVVVPTARAADGLALSSRNVYLSPEQRATAPTLYRALQAAAAQYAAGETDAAVLRATVEAPILAAAPVAGPIDYISIADPRTLQELARIGPNGALIALAVRFGTVRLIDNITLDPR
jgi:pantoate--beta-alanine ligase